MTGAILTKRPRPYVLPSYSLTGDLLGFLRCGLQYRYSRVGKLPPSEPVQLWFGEFIHGVMEEAWRRFDEARRSGQAMRWPWSDVVVGEVVQQVTQRLRSRGLRAWSEETELLGRRRAVAAIQDLGPALFPLVSQAEVRVTGTRALPKIPDSLAFREADRYEMVGVIDVVSSVELADPAQARNPVVAVIRAALPRRLPPSFEVIVDYKGVRRPGLRRRRGPSAPDQLGIRDYMQWQVQTYANLRSGQPGAREVVAGVLVYVNELAPTEGDLRELRREIGRRETDLVPRRGSDDARRLDRWTGSGSPPELSADLRLRRAIEVVPVDQVSVQRALISFDAVVRDMEQAHGREMSGTPLRQAWPANPSNEQTCAACDQRPYCPAYAAKGGRGSTSARPSVPAVRVR